MARCRSIAAAHRLLVIVRQRLAAASIRLGEDIGAKGRKSGLACVAQVRKPEHVFDTPEQRVMIVRYPR